MSGPLDGVIEINGIRFNPLGWFPLSYMSTRQGRTGGIILTAQLVDGEYFRDQVSSALVGQSIEGKKIRGVEMFAVDQQTDKKIGLLI